ncbi:linear amide C-N hydrolase [Maribellus comscasis]|uniref:Linear amide C-N hydrolase n=1 Tax=Maribellus comscasis TaxID=2681766 RepID=A0A6I6JPF3_9BACT|nr:carcinine hydrolase/isopenicillin-N N-acyltransferase family protein [Maribellus comscasis]QGY42112.1 linear amide C-N hydrolase [Maribellus comscasis]
MTLKISAQIIHRKKGDYVTVRHLQLWGSNREIGFQLGKIARKQHSVLAVTNPNPAKNECQKKYIQQNYPVHFERMKGFAEAFGESLVATDKDFSCFGHLNGTIACSAIFYPAEFTQTKTGILSRNADLPLITFQEIMGQKPSPDSKSVLSNPYIIETYPDKGYATLSTFSFELYGLALDGINSEGLVISHLHADSVNISFYKPTKGFGVGINEMLAVQFLLDNCKNAEDAKKLLLLNKHFYMFLPTHLIVADKDGNSFIWEYSSNHNEESIISGNQKIQIITNFPVHQFLHSKNFPASIDDSCPFARFRTLEKAIKDNGKNLSLQQIKNINSTVFIQDKMCAKPLVPPVRTVYHNLYDTANSSMEISFYRKDEADCQLRTKYYKFQLK